MRDAARLAVLAACLATVPVLAGPLDALLGTGANTIPAPEQVFRMRAVGGGQPRLELDIAPGYYLYRDTLRVTATDGGPVALELPPGESVRDAHYGTVAVLRGRVPVPAALPAPPASVTVDYQGCAQDRLCYAPARRTLTVDPA